MASDPVDREAEVALMLSEMNWRLEELGRRREAIASRAGILVASATIGGSLLAAAIGDKGLAIASVALSLGAALCGTLVLIPSRAHYMKLSEVRTELYSRAAARGSLWLFDQKSVFYNEVINGLHWRGVLTITGYGLLTVAIMVGLVAMARAG